MTIIQVWPTSEVLKKETTEEKKRTVESHVLCLVVRTGDEGGLGAYPNQR